MKTPESAAGMRGMLVFRLAALLVLGLLPAWPAHAQSPLAKTPQSATPVQQAEEDPLGRSNPHGTVLGFIRAAKAKDYDRAAEYLDTKKKAAAAEELAKQLQIVMDRGLNVNLDRISRKPEGDLQDESRTTRERIGIVEYLPPGSSLRSDSDGPEDK